MRRSLGLLLVAGLTALDPAVVCAATPPLLPIPAVVEERSGSFALSGASLADRSPAAGRFAELLRRAGGPALPVRADGNIRFVTDPMVRGEEAYRIDVGRSGITVAASDPAGLFYGAETLWQIAASAPGGRIAAIHIEDRPSFRWRGFMLDSARHFQPVDYIERQLDRMAEVKLNVFHWHLSDDEGWRIQIDRYPRLTSVGAWRTEAGTGKRYGGFYSKAEVRRIVAYAAARHIAVVPEIDVPGHATAMIAAYPALASISNPPREPSNEWGVLPNVLNTENATFVFIENVLDEVMALFPGRYVHVGGDEAPKDQWKADPRAQARIKALGLKDEDALQGWFTGRLGDYLAKHGRRLIGWDEILSGDVPASATVMSWRGIEGAVKAAQGGHDTVLAPAPVLYLDNRQSDADDETPGRGEIVDWQRIYAFDPEPATLSAAERARILGLQANLFTEHAPTPAYAERMTWPRAALLAEVGWSPATMRNWQGAAPRLVATLARWDRLGWRYDTVPLAVQARIDGEQAVLRQPAGIGAIRFTTDGTGPGPGSPLYAKPIREATQVTAQAFLGDLPLAGPQSWTVDAMSARTRVAADMALCSNRLPLRLVDPVTGRIHWVDIMQACWRWPAAPLDGVTRVAADVGSVPFNFSLGADLAAVKFRPPETPLGELEIRQDTCDGPRIAVLPLVAGVSRIEGSIRPTTPGAHDLCMTFTQRSPDPLHVLDRLTLEPAR